MQETCENLLEGVFIQVTDEQLGSLELKTGHQRMDSVLVSRNIRKISRLHLLVEVVQHVWRMLTEATQVHCTVVFGPYRQGTAYCHRVKADGVAERLEAIGQLMYGLVQELETRYVEERTHRVLQRIFDECFALVAGEEAGHEQVREKSGEELSASSLQSPDDWEATYREKRGQGHRGYVANLTETCDPENEVQLVTQVQGGPQHHRR